MDDTSFCQQKPYPCTAEYCTLPHCQERIIEKKGRGREHETTTHLIKFPVFTHASRVTIFRYDYDACIRMYVSNSATPMQRELSRCEKD